MRASFSPTAQAARLLAARAGSAAAPASAPGGSSSPAPSWRATEERWCEWPRRSHSLAPFGSIRRALQQIQARHA
jgi:hypothetical protein